MPKSPRVIYTLLSDSHKLGAAGKFDAFGIFSWMVVWGLPATREFSFTCGILNPGTSKLSLVLLLKEPDRSIRQIATAEIGPALGEHSITFAERVSLSLRRDGPHEIGVGVKGASERLIRWTPLEIRLQALRPLPSGDELASILSDPHSVKALRAEIQCKKCSARFLFEINANPSAAPSKGAIRFPESGRFQCTQCGTVLHTRDIEGQLRGHIGRPVPGAAT